MYRVCNQLYNSFVCVSLANILNFDLKHICILQYSSFNFVIASPVYRMHLGLASLLTRCEKYFYNLNDHRYAFMK